MPTFAYRVANALELAAHRLRQMQPPPPAHPHAADADRWPLMLAQFTFIADRGRTLATWRELRDTFNMTRHEYNLLTGYMAAAGAIVKRPRQRTRWAWNWNQKKFQRYLKLNLIPLPYPDTPAPVSFYRREHDTAGTVHTTTHRPPL